MERDAFILSKKLRETSLTLAEKDREVLLRNEHGGMSRTQRLSTNVGLMPSTHLFILFFFSDQRRPISAGNWQTVNQGAERRAQKGEEEERGGSNITYQNITAGRS